MDRSGVMHAAVFAPIPFVLVSMMGCGGNEASPREWSGSVDTLAGGAIVVSNPAVGTWSDPGAWTLDEELRMGSAEGTGPATFNEVTALAVDAAGRIYVLDGRADEVRVFGPDGVHVRTLGRSGAGPGELATPFGLAIGHDGSLWVADARNARYTVFDSSGALVATHPRPFSYFRMPWPGGLDSAGRVIDAAMLSEGDLLKPVEILVRLSETFQARDTIRLPRYTQPERMTVRGANGGLVMSFPDPYAPELVWRFDPRGALWSAVSARYEVVHQTLHGDTVRIIRRDAPAVPVSASERESRLAAIRERVASAGPGATLDRQPRVPDSKPALETFYVDSEGFLWVEPSRPVGQPQRFDVFDAEGRFLGMVEPATEIAKYPLPVFRGDAMYGVVRDTLDVPYVVRLRIQGRK